jgi:GGDEF domain-containing protein
MVRIEREFAAFANLTPRGSLLGCSLGVVSYEGQWLPDLDTMIATADARMYAVKMQRAHGIGPSTVQILPSSFLSRVRLATPKNLYCRFNGMTTERTLIPEL